MGLNKKKRKHKKGVSPVIATVLLIAMVIVIALIIFLWFRGLTREAITKFEGVNVELVCEDVSLVVNYFEDSDRGEIYVSNVGNVPVYSLHLKITSTGNHKTVDIRDFSPEDMGNIWPPRGLTSGRGFSGNVYSETVGANQILVIPVLMGNFKGEERTHVCDERHGYLVY